MIILIAGASHTGKTALIYALMTDIFYGLTVCKGRGRFEDYA